MANGIGKLVERLVGDRDPKIGVDHFLYFLRQYVAGNSTQAEVQTALDITDAEEIEELTLALTLVYTGAFTSRHLEQLRNMLLLGESDDPSGNKMLATNKIIATISNALGQTIDDPDGMAPPLKDIFAGSGNLQTPLPEIKGKARRRG